MTTGEPLDTILNRLSETQEHNPPSGTYWMAHCPAHHDPRKSLSITTNERGDVLLNCFAGCGFQSVMHALGLKPRAAFADNNEDNNDLEQRVEELEREQKRIKHEQEEQAERIRKLEMLQRRRPDLMYHENLTDEHLAHWEQEGIYPHAVDDFNLGYCPSCPTWRSSSSHTIPVYSIADKLVNVRHRLTDESAGKYRPEMAGLGTTLYNASILRKPRKRVIVLEGEKKAIVFAQHGWHAVGTMGKSFDWKPRWTDWLRSAREIVIGLDPDATEEAWGLGEHLVKNDHKNVRVARFPTKPDDAINLHGAQFADIEAILKNARVVG